MNSFYDALAKVGYTHPVHPILTYLPIGLVMASLIFGLLAWLLHYSNLAATARHCTILALAGAFPTILTGFLDWQHFYGGAWIFPIKMKILLAVVLLILLSITTLLLLKVGQAARGILVMYFLCFLTTVGIGYFGGELVFATKSGASLDSNNESNLGANKITYSETAKIFEQRCTTCHSGSNPPDGLRLDTYENVMAGGEDGPVVITGKPDESELMHRIKGLKQPSMPFRQPPLPDEEIQVIETWIAQGAPA